VRLVADKKTPCEVAKEHLFLIPMLVECSVVEDRTSQLDWVTVAAQFQIFTEFHNNIFNVAPNQMVGKCIIVI